MYIVYIGRIYNNHTNIYISGITSFSFARLYVCGYIGLKTMFYFDDRDGPRSACPAPESCRAKMRGAGGDGGRRAGGGGWISATEWRKKRGKNEKGGEKDIWSAGPSPVGARQPRSVCLWRHQCPLTSQLHPVPVFQLKTGRPEKVNIQRIKNRNWNRNKSRK